MNLSRNLGRVQTKFLLTATCTRSCRLLGYMTSMYVLKYITGIVYRVKVCMRPVAPGMAQAFHGDAVIVDLRTGPAFPHALTSVLHNVRGVLPDSWLVHAEISSSVTRRVRWLLHRVPMLSHALHCKPPCAALRISPRRADNATQGMHVWYNRLLRSRSFWSGFPTPWVLLFELDSCLCPGPTRPLASFMKAGYTFVGAPWRKDVCYWDHPLSDRHGSSARSLRADISHLHCVGNSGLSLWKRADILALLAAIQSSPVKDPFQAHLEHGIDLWFSSHLQSRHWRHLQLGGVPNRSEAALFSMEGHYVPRIVPVGMHVYRRNHRFALLSQAEEQSMVRRCPPLATVFYRYDARHGPLDEGRRAPEQSSH